MGLIARTLEGRGIPTLSLSCARSITEAVNPPRAAFLDFPLGRTAGPPGDKRLQRRILLDALAVLETATRPGVIQPLPHPWPGGNAWKSQRRPPGRKAAAAPKDERAARLDSPQYQTREDEAAAAACADAGNCPGCVFPPEGLAA